MTLLAVRFLSLLVARLPEPATRALAAVLGECIYRLIPSRRHLVLSNLAHAFPDRPHAWRVRTARASCRQLVETGLLAAAFPNLTIARLRTMIAVGPSMARNMPELTRTPGPVVAALPHLGAWELAAALPLAWDDTLPPIGCIYRPLDHPVIDRWIRQARERFGARLLSRQAGLTEGQRMLREGGALVILFDQRPRDRGSLSLFLDRVCNSTNLPELMVAKFDARLVMVFPRRTGFWRYQLELHLAPAVSPEPGAVTRHLDAWLGSLLRGDDALCASWLWLHDRWKTQLAPERRFRLEHKRSFLAPGELLPRRTRFFVRLPDDPSCLPALLPRLEALRASRPDAALIAMAPRGAVAALESAGVCEEVIPLPSPGAGYWMFFCRLRRRFPDCWIVLEESRRAELEAWMAGCPQRFGWARRGRHRPLLTHVVRLPGPAARAGEDPGATWDAFFRHFGLRSEDTPGATADDRF